MQFLVLGLAVFVVERVGARRVPSASELRVGGERLSELEAEHRRATGRMPSAVEERQLIAQLVDEEVLYREALALGLDRDDPIVRRRLIQKAEFVLDGAAAIPEPSDAQLDAWLRAHPDEFRAPAAVSFTHVFLSTARRAPATALDEEARVLLARLVAMPTSSTALPSLGDPFLPGASFTLRTARELDGSFGPGFGDRVLGSPPGRWSGPIASAFGVHLVRVGEVRPPQAAPLATIRERVRLAFLDEQRRGAQAEARARLRAKYRVVVEGAALAGPP